jgi:RNA polymerase sigma factor (sigma-70 family)
MGLGGLNRVVARLRQVAGGPGTDAPSDQELLAAVAAGDRIEAFRCLVERHGAMVRGVCRRVLRNDDDADDAFQATFLVLARKASSAWGESVAAWLYGVAYRVALRARRGALRRRHHEGRLTPRAEGPGPESAAWREVQAVLDEELMRLPDKFRLPLVLCCLHDRTAEEASRTLGWPVTTVTGRLQRGRELLRQRLARRGVLAGVGVLAALAPTTAAPTALVISTVELAVGGAVSGPVAALATEVARMMIWRKVKAVAAVFLGVGLLVCGGAVYFRTEATPLPEPTREAAKENSKLGEASSPVEKDGLSVTVKPTQAVFAFGETPTFEITYVNKTDKVMRLHDVGFECLYWDFQRKEDAGPWRSGPYFYLTRPAASDAQLNGA